MVHSGCGLAPQFHDVQAVPRPVQADIGGYLKCGCEAGHDADHLLPLVPSAAGRAVLPQAARCHAGRDRHHAHRSVLLPQSRVLGDELCSVLRRFRRGWRAAPATLQSSLSQAVHRQVAEAKQGVPPVPPGHTGHAECSRQEEGLGGGSRRQGAPRSRRASGPRTRCSFIIGEVERAVRRRLTDAPRARCAVVLSGIVSGGQLRPRSLSPARIPQRTHAMSTPTSTAASTSTVLLRWCLESRCQLSSESTPIQTEHECTSWRGLALHRCRESQRYEPFFG
mmetsp:Transcript_22438/g.60040  ORF Transcript_22438/g.60040 Transcript_22438/m.60040 type:complete len:280 (-) Transcript_22438:446-1285(-)